MKINSRSYTDPNYSHRYGFNGMVEDNELKGEGNSYSTLFREYDPRVGRFLSLDPSLDKYPNLSPYVAFADNPIRFVDLDVRDLIIRTRFKKSQYYQTYLNLKSTNQVFQKMVRGFRNDDFDIIFDYVSSESMPRSNANNDINKAAATTYPTWYKDQSGVVRSTESRQFYNSDFACENNNNKLIFTEIGKAVVILHETAHSRDDILKQKSDDSHNYTAMHSRSDIFNALKEFRDDNDLDISDTKL